MLPNIEAGDRGIKGPVSHAAIGRLRTVPGRALAVIRDAERREHALSRRKASGRALLMQLLRIDRIRYLVAAVRYVWFVEARRNLRVFDNVTVAVAENAIRHNWKGLRRLDVARSSKLILPLMALGQDRLGDRVLSVGPRAEGELLNLAAWGFPWSGITGVDLLSYSPKIDLGDMHALPYERATFDVVVAGFVLSYSDNKARAASEIVRVVRPGGVVAIGSRRMGRSVDEVLAERGYIPGSADRIESIDDLRELFAPYIDEVFVALDSGRDPSTDSDLVFIFSTGS